MLSALEEYYTKCYRDVGLTLGLLQLPAVAFAAAVAAAVWFYLFFSIFSWPFELGVVPAVLPDTIYHILYAAATPILYRAACYYVKVQFRKFKLQDKMTHTVKIIFKKNKKRVHMHPMMANESVGDEAGEGR